MSRAELIYKKAKLLPGNLQTEALDFVEYLERRRTAPVQAAEWQRLSQETRSLSSTQSITQEDIAAEIAAYRACQ